MASKKQTITPFIPPVIERLEKRGGGPSTPASSLMHRMGKREVDEEVTAVVAWALSHFHAKPHTTALWDPRVGEKLSRPRLTERVEKELLDDLGLEWKEEPMGGLLLVPKAEYAAVPKGPKRRTGDIDYNKAMANYGGWKDAERYYFPSPAMRDAFVAELREAGLSGDAEVVLAHATIKSKAKPQR